MDACFLDDLNQTQGAISHQVNTLEKGLGVKLFEREARGLKLTEAGGDICRS
jgi:LysR family transcriptional regulator, glycine cleavage system transcriptional activator